MANLEGRVAIVTGAGRGIGREEALELARNGAKVVINDVGAHFDGTGADRTPSQQVVDEIKAFGGEAVANYESVTDFAGAKRIIECALDTFGELHIVVNNAGILRDRMIFNMAEEDFDAVINVHLKGTFNVSRHACAYFREANKEGKDLQPRIINTASDAGLLGNPGQANYGAAKAGIATMSIIIDMEMSRYGVACNCIAPLARTRLTVDATPSTAAIMGQTPEGEFDPFHPKHIAPLVAYLGSVEAGSIHGQVFRVGAGTVWGMQGWHSVAKISKKGFFTVEELSKRIQEELLPKLPPKEEITAVFTEIQF